MSSPPLRRLPRVPFVQRVAVEVLQPALGQAQVLWARDVSKGGMFIRTDAPLPVGSRIRVAVDLPDGSLPVGEAEVMWGRSSAETAESQAPSGFGMRFLVLAPRGKAFVDTVLKHGGTRDGPVPAAPVSVLPPEPKTDPE
jgi:uncharacterized protein (TIGR02266 family)